VWDTSFSCRIIICSICAFTNDLKCTPKAVLTVQFREFVEIRNLSLFWLSAEWKVCSPVRDGYLVHY